MKKGVFDMDAIEFIGNYPVYISELETIVKPELMHVLDKLKNEDPHDLVGPDVWFVSNNQARGYVLNLFLKKCKEV